MIDYLQETPLSEDQTVTEMPENSKMPYTLSATVLNTKQLHWWLIHYGASIEIVAPTELRELFKTTVAAMADLYNR